VSAARDAPEFDVRARPGPGTDWLYNRLTISGPVPELERFRAAARGTGAVPWALDLDAEEARLFAPMAADGARARALARALREVIAARHDRMLAGWAGPGGCPLDLHRLIPVPGALLALGEDDPAAQAWLRTHWGTMQPLRHVRRLAADAGRRRHRIGRTMRGGRIVLEFWAADWTPWQAIRRLRRDWPALRFAVAPRYDDG